MQEGRTEVGQENAQVGQGVWKRSGSGWPRTLLDNVPLWLLQHGLQNPQADDDPKKNNEGNAGDTGGYYAERKVFLTGLKDR